MASTTVTPAAYCLDDASIELGKAWGLALLCTSSTAIGDPACRDASAIRDLDSTIRYIASKVADVEARVDTVPPNVRDAIDSASAICRVIRAELIHEVGAGPCFQWNDEISDFAMNSLCDAIKQAKDVVEAASLARVG